MDTIRDTILSFPGLEDTPDSFVNRVIKLRGLEGAAEYTVEQDKNVCLSAADLYVAMANSNDFSENKLSVTYSRKQFIERAKQLYRDNGEPEKVARLETKRIIIKGKAGNRW